MWRLACMIPAPRAVPRVRDTCRRPADAGSSTTLARRDIMVAGLCVRWWRVGALRTEDDTSRVDFMIEIQKLILASK